ncbi:RNA polymerase sigma-F factor SigF [Gottschalkia acidurici 9a]|uniref:RNA polymerase sigma-F factor SigF n=1 Tax=Gottschalkia acidurici (strain ATCC 7906 / DSM 604 / BCRC 14475 / CIP 104303 / KCTC 5404 / NCIMB 10678 / 9a) TaxID=1128398 RepID=K0AZB7_GOTA9|nr:RNA polymerase sporulation sigma factor SigF [Gottschalkia acidurici]AFS78045.1 RNA polymerase sigma-F factor SigF [Gottschalkia acidurici 9a]
METSTLEQGTYELLDHEETMRLIKKAQNGDEEAKTKLINHNLGLVKSVLKRFANRGYELEDLYQIGCIGLLKGIQKFDTSFDVRFSTYAVPMIMGEIRRFLRDDGIIKVSRSLKQTATNANMAKERLTKELGREPTIQELSEAIDVDKEDIVMALDANTRPDYLYEVIHESDGSPIHLIDKVMGTEDENTDILNKIALKEVLGKLKPRERQIIVLRYFNDKTQTEIGEILGISQVQVSRIEKKVLESMKNILQKV